MGSRVLQSLRDEVGSKPIFSVSVLPRLSGEVILQYYNAVFSMSTLYNECDGVILFDNSQASKICEKVYGVKRPDFKEMNDILSV